MQQGTKYIIAAGISLGCLSMLYFFSLVLSVPFLITVPVIFAAVFFVARWFNKDEDKLAEDQPLLSKLSLYILIAGIAVIVSKSQTLALKYGGWDAWSIWNFHAKYLASGDQWKNLFNNIIDHPDYPLLLPGINGFFMRLFMGHAETSILFIVSFSIMLFIPVLIYLELLKRNIIVATIILFLMANDVFFLQNSVTQYADTPLAFFFLGAIICTAYIDVSKKYIIAAAACIGCCMWTKNEGVILAAIFFAFNFRQFFSLPHVKYTLAGIALPLVTFLVFKLHYAPPNDIVGQQSRETFRQLFEPGRYKTIWVHFTQELDQNFYYAKVGFALYLLVCLIGKKWPERQFLMLTTCLLAYLAIYVLTTQALEWHLATSLNRLMLQLLPAMLFVFGQKFSGGKISFFAQKSF
jgi:hypothetical protein